MDQRRLLIVVNDLRFFLSHRLPVAEAASRAGWEVHLATAPEPDRGVAVPPFIIRHTIPISRSGTHPLRELRTIRALWALFRRVRPTVVHNVTVKPVVYGGIAARMAGVPGVVGAVSGLGHVFAGDSRKQRALRSVLIELYRVAMRHPNSRLIFQNEVDRGILEGAGVVPRSQSVIIRGSGVDLNLFRPTAPPEGILTVLMSSRLLKEKGALEFADAARRVRSAIASRFLLAGACDPANPSSLTESDLEPWIADGSIEWLGHRQDMPALLQQCHVYVLPSYYAEGIPKALIEAAAAGLPLVTTDMPGCRDVVTDGENGILVPSRDSSALAEAILALLKDGALRRRMGSRSRQIAEVEFSIDGVTRKHLTLYEELASAGPRDR